MRSYRCGVVLAWTVASCGSKNVRTDDAAQPTVDGPPKDSGPIIDAPQYVTSVDCAGIVPDATVVSTSGSYQYDPQQVTILVGQSVKFTMPVEHDVEPDPVMSDPGLAVDFSEIKCLTFTVAGTFNFHCGPHQFHGSIVVALPPP
jgi:plastocyanin